MHAHKKYIIDLPGIFIIDHHKRVTERKKYGTVIVTWFIFTNVLIILSFLCIDEHFVK